MADLKYELTKQDESTTNDCKQEVLIPEGGRKKLNPSQKTWAIIVFAVIVFIAFMFLIGIIVLGVQVKKLETEMKKMKDTEPCKTVDCINAVSGQSNESAPCLTVECINAVSGRPTISLLSKSS